MLIYSLCDIFKNEVFRISPRYEKYLYKYCLIII